ncbi:MAG: hypothetical protein ACOVLE_12860 [Pirellula staleyi]
MAQVVVELTGDEAKLLRSMQKVVEQNSKTKDSFKGVAKESKDASGSMSSGFSDVATKIVGATSATALLTVGINTVAKSQQAFVERAQESLALVKEIAAAQQEAAKNLAGNTPQQISETLQTAVPDIARKSDFSDLGKITTALGSSASIVGEEAARSAVEASAKLTRFKKDDLQTTSTATADVMKAAGMTDAREAMALLLTSGAVARPEELPKLATGASKAIYAGVDASPNQNPLDAAKDSAALFAVFSKVDKNGESAATASIQMINLLRETFNPTRDDTMKRDDRIAELLKEQAITAEEQVAIDRANLSIQQKQAIVNRVDPNDMSMGAKDARIDLSEAQASLTRATKTATLSDKDSEELRRLQTQKQLASNDPGNLMGRMQAVQQSPELMRTVEANLKGEAQFRAIAKGFFDPDSVHMKGLTDALGSITTDVTKFDEALKTMEITPQQKIALASERGDTANAVAKFQDTPMQQYGLIDKIVSDALKQNKGTGIEAFLNAAGEGIANSIGISSSVSAGSFSPEQARLTAIEQLKTRQAEVQNESFFSSTVSPDAKRKSDSLQGSIDALEKMKVDIVAPKPKVLKGEIDPIEPAMFVAEGIEKVAAGIQESNRLIQQQNDKVEKQNSILTNTKDSIDQSSRPQAPQIRAMNAGVTTN